MDTTSPEHPSNQIPDAAYPTSDYRPTNNLAPSSKGAQEPPIPLHPISAVHTQAGSSSSSSQPGHNPLNRWQNDPLHLDLDYVPPPPYEESDSRPNTSSQNTTTQTHTSGQHPPSPSQSVSSTTLLRPSTQPRASSTVPRPPPTYVPFNVPFVGRFSRHGAPGQQGANNGQTNPEMQTLQARRARRRKMICCIGALVAVFVMAFIIGLSLGLKKDDDDDDNIPPFAPITTRPSRPLPPDIDGG